MRSTKSLLRTEDVLKALTQVNVSAFLDKWGPEKIIQVYDPETPMQGILVIDNTVLGPGKGGIILSPTLTPLMVFKLARTMTWKCTLAEIPFGGAMSGIRANPYEIDKIKYIKAFAQKIAPFIPLRYIAGPDLHVGEKEIAAFVETIGDLQGATGKPEKLGGIPHEVGITGFGLGIALETGLKILHDSLHLPNSVSETKIAIQGFNTLGLGVARYLNAKKSTIVAINDYWGTIYQPEGIDIRKAEKFSYATSERQSIKNYRAGSILDRDDIFNVDCDIFVTCAECDLINRDTYKQIKAKYIVEGANNCITAEAEKKLFERGAIILPDFLASAGGVIGSYAEYRKMDVASAFSLIETKIKKNTQFVIEKALDADLVPRKVAIEIAQQRILDALEEKSRRS